MAEWTCRKCRQLHHTKRFTKCASCGTPRPATKKPKHMRALDHSYEHYVELNGGENCGACGRPPDAKRRNDRDHDHATGEPRGLLCRRCNRLLTRRVEPLLPLFAAYIQRHKERVR